VNVDFEDEPLAYILEDLGDRYKLNIRFNETILPDGRFTYSFDRIAISDVLRILLRDHNLDLRTFGENGVILFPREIAGNEGRAQVLDSLQRIDSQTALDTTFIMGEVSPEKGLTEVTCEIFLIDQSTFFPVANALVLNMSTGEHFSAGIEGEMILTLAPGIYEFQVSSITHQTFGYNLDVRGPDRIDILLKPKVHLIDEIVISGKSPDFAIEETVTGLERLSRKEIKQLNSFMGEADVVKSILTIAGVNSIGEGSSGFNVRGGSIDQNLILQDGIVIFNPSHILGFFSTFNPDIVLGSSLNKGHIPSNYGGRISSVLDVDIKEGNYEQLALNGSAGFISSKISVESPIIKQKSSILFSGRISHAEWFLKELDNFQIRNSLARFHDFNVKYSHRLGEKTKVVLAGFQSRDKFQYYEEFGYAWQNGIAQLALSHIASDRFSLNVTAAIGSLQNEQFEPTGPLAFSLTSGIKYNQAKAEGIYQAGNHTFRGGFDYMKYNMSPEELGPIGDSQTPHRIVEKEKGREAALYLNDQWEVTNNLSINFGLRISTFSQLGPSQVNSYERPFYFSSAEILTQYDAADNEKVTSYHGIEPRISARWKMSENFSVKASYNRIYQYLHLLSNTATPTPVDIWQVSNTHLRPLAANNFSVGIFQKLADNLDYSLDVYYRQLENTVNHKDFADLLLQQNLETQVLIGEGRTYGLEFTLDKKGEKFSGKLSYGYARSEHRTDKTEIEQINGGAWFPSNFDQPHSFKFFINWNFSRRDRLNINFIYATGRPITAPIANYLVQGIVIPSFTERNMVRLPDYHRLDIGYTFRLNRRRSSRYRSDFTFSLYNVYARRNAFSVFYRQKTGSVVNALRLSVVGAVVPAVSYNFQF
jgi:hypothetical protein